MIVTVRSFWSDKERLKEPNPPHYKLTDEYCCGCVSCEQWRGARVLPGRLCRPATQDPRKMSPGTVPAWPLGTWRTTGWNFRLEPNGVKHMVVVSYIDMNDKDNGGHLDCVLVLTQELEPRLLVTSRKWLVALA